jgi:hypothetical protein
MHHHEPEEGDEDGWEKVQAVLDLGVEAVGEHDHLGDLGHAQAALVLPMHAPWQKKLRYVWEELFHCYGPAWSLHLI